MNPIIRNILAVIAGCIIGGSLNMAIIEISPVIIPPPEGANLKTMEGLLAAMKIMEPRHFIMPFLAHALGTFVGALIAASLAHHYKIAFALGIGMFFLMGGILAVMMLPSPLWFTMLDLTIAYLPMAYLAGALARAKASQQSS